MGFDFVNSRMTGASGSQEYNTLLGGTTAFVGTLASNASSSITYTFTSGSAQALRFNNGILISAV